jgi:hypothetical protein
MLLPEHLENDVQLILVLGFGEFIYTTYCEIRDNARVRLSFLSETLFTGEVL